MKRFSRHADELLAPARGADVWRKLPDAEPDPRGVARIAEAADGELGLPEAAQTRAARAALLHDVGRIGVSNAIWDKPGPLDEGEWEKVRLHPYFTERIVRAASPWQSLSTLASSDHERQGKRGYPRGAPPREMPDAAIANLLAAADIYQALIEPRPHRPARDASHAAEELEREVAHFAGCMFPQSARRRNGYAALLAGMLALAACGGKSGDGTGVALGSRIIRGAPEHAPPTTHDSVFRIADWNIKAARDSSISAIGSKLMALDPDVVALQEVDVGTRRTGEIDEPAVLGRALGYHYAFAPTIPWDGGLYGIALLSRYPFEALGRIQLSNRGATEARTALEARVCAASACVRIVDHHADEALPAAELNVTEVLKQIQPELGKGIALLGDMNQSASDPGPRACVAAGLVDLGAKFGSAPTFGSDRIDFAFADAAIASCAQGVEVEHGNESDHELLVVDFDMACLAAPR